MSSTHNKPLYNRQTLRTEQLRLKGVVREQELELRNRLQRLPGEMVYAGVDAVLPDALTGAFSVKVLSAVRDFINGSIAGESTGFARKLVTTAKKLGVLALARSLYQSFIRRK